ncbi:MAG: hypothetical protein ACFFF9_08785 [Candidatus Thorarchaeota archaeon]
MKWSKEICSVLILTLLLVMTSVYESISETNEFDDCTDQVIMRDTGFESYVQSSDNETIAWGPFFSIDVYWGWVGNLSFTYWDVLEEEGISGANVSCRLGPFWLNYYDLNNGSYYVELDTTILWAQYYPYFLTVHFDKSGFNPANVVISVLVDPVHTHLEVFSPEVSQLNGHPLELEVPLGDSIEIMFFYNDIESSHASGLEGAQAYAYIVGPTLVEHYIEVVDQGNGNYSLTFDTTEEWLYESVGGESTSHELPYLIRMEFALENREPWECLLNITIIDIPTEFNLTYSMEKFVFDEGEDLYLDEGYHSMFVSLRDIWPTHGGVLVQGLNVTVESSDPTLLEVVSITENSSEPGVYNITMLHKVPAWAPGGCSPGTYAYVELSVELKKEGYEGVKELLTIGLWGGGGHPTPPVYSYGLPSLIFVIVAIVVCVRRENRKAQ